MNDKDEVRLRHILDAVNDIQENTANTDFEDFFENKLLRKAVERDLITIGEAVSHLSPKVRETNNDWRKIKALRNLVIHEYFGVDPMEIWDIVEVRLPELKVWAEKLLKSAEK